MQDDILQPTTGPATPIAQELFTPSEDPFVELEDCSSGDEECDFEGWLTPSEGRWFIPRIQPNTQLGTSKSSYDMAKISL